MHAGGFGVVLKSPKRPELVAKVFKREVASPGPGLRKWLNSLTLGSIRISLGNSRPTDTWRQAKTRRNDISSQDYIITVFQIGFCCSLGMTLGRTYATGASEVRWFKLHCQTIIVREKVTDFAFHAGREEGQFLATLMTSLLDAVHYLHTAFLLHMDIKVPLCTPSSKLLSQSPSWVQPSNVGIAEDGKAVLLDLGLCRTLLDQAFITGNSRCLV